jgi:retron-type reverse transcriptase
LRRRVSTDEQQPFFVGTSSKRATYTICNEDRHTTTAITVGLTWGVAARSILDADIRGFFTRMSHEWTMKFIQHRVADKRVRLIQKWLKAGVSEDGEWSKT